MYTYNQTTGKFEHDRVVICVGYSGYAKGKNNPTMQHVSNTGPIPEGSYTIGEPYDTKEHGAIVMRLMPSPKNEMFGRSGFLIHGDNATNNASRGCIILPRNIRKLIVKNNDKYLKVIKG